MFPSIRGVLTKGYRTPNPWPLSRPFIHGVTPYGNWRYRVKRILHL
jgi:hypothetical protein